MPLAGVLELLVVQPVLLVCETLFEAVRRVSPDAGWDVLLFALVTHLLLLPLLGWAERSRRGGAGSVLVQAALYAAAWRFLATRDTIAGVPFHGIADLGRPDGLLLGANVLPVLTALLTAAVRVLARRDVAARPGDLVLPVLVLVFLYPLPAWLALYGTAGNILLLAGAAARRGLGPLLPERLVRGWSRLRVQE